MEQTDAELKASVESLIKSEATINASHIEVFAEQGFINLNGSVTDKEQKLAVEELIRSGSQAKGVFNYLVVRPVGLLSSETP